MKNAIPDPVKKQPKTSRHPVPKESTDEYARLRKNIPKGVKTTPMEKQKIRHRMSKSDIGHLLSVIKGTVSRERRVLLT